MATELVPIGTLLTVLTNQVNKTALAAKDVDLDCFKVLSAHLFHIEHVLKESQQQQKLDVSPDARQALEFLGSDINKANNLTEFYKNRSRFYLVVQARFISKEVKEVTMDIGRSLGSLSFANAELKFGISEQVNWLQNEMQRAEFEDYLFQLQILDKLNQGLMNRKHKQANDLLKQIATAIGVPEVNQVVSQVDVSRDYEEVRRQYLQRLQVIKSYDNEVEYIEPLEVFICGISKVVMVDPVCLCTGTVCERAALETWFCDGKKTDPATDEIVEDLSYRSNPQLRESIQEWKELNYCLKIRSCKAKLLSEVDSSVEEALGLMQELMRDNSINKYWISFGGLTDIIISFLGTSQNEDVKRQILITLKGIVEGHARNKDLLVENKGLEYVFRCLGCDSSISKAVVELMYEILRDRSGWIARYCRKVTHQCGAIPFLVAIRESTEKAEEILVKLCDDDDENIIQAAKADWYTPLINRISEGSASSRILLVRALISSELNEHNIKLLGKEGIIPPLLEMTFGTLESKNLSLSMLMKLLNCHQNKSLIAAAGGVPLVLKLMFSSHIDTTTIITCSEFLKKLSSDGDGIKFLVDGNGTQLELESLITNLLDLQQNSDLSLMVRRPALHALLGICQSEAGLVKTAVLKFNGVSLILPLLDDSDILIREAAIYLLFLFSEHEPQGVVEYLLMPRRLEALVGLLENDDKGDVQMAAAGIIANLPKVEKIITTRLIEVDGLKAIINILKSGTLEAKEKALSALFRFTDPTNIESQMIVVELGTYPLLVDLLKVGSVTAKARAGALIRDLSMHSPELTIVSTNTGCWSFRRKRVPICPAHGTTCSVSSTSCLLEANALPKLVELSKEETEERKERAEFVFLDRVTELLSRVNAATRLMPFEGLQSANPSEERGDLVQKGKREKKDRTQDRQHVFAFLIGVVAVFSVSLLVLVLCGSCFLYLLGYYRNNQKIKNQSRRLESEVQEDSQASLASMNEEEVEIEEDIILRNKEKVGKGSLNVGSPNLKSYSKKAKKNIQDLNYPPSFAPVQVCRCFTFDDIKLATENFNDGFVIGKGGFGKVYKGFIDNGATIVAIKRLDPFSKQGGKEFWTEIDMLSKFRHSHLVSLIGYCNNSDEMILLYEHMSNGSMADHLHIKKAKNGNNRTLSWVLRLKICIGTARGLEYLHTGTGFLHRVIHRDVKSSNILLDENWTAKISDFGLSKVGPANQSCTQVSTFVKGTPGYCDPEYFLTRRLTRKSDVYSFGVVLFEVLCGRPVLDSRLPEEQRSLVAWAQQCIQEDKVHKIIDPNLRCEIFPDSLDAFVKIADQCLHSRRKKRPTMAEVVASLESALALQERKDSSLLDEYIFSFGETCDNQ